MARPWLSWSASVATLLLGIAPASTPAYAKPVSLDAGALCERLGVLWARPLPLRALEATEIQPLLDAIRSGSVDAQTCAALLLAHAKDDASLEALRVLATAGTAQAAGAATFALHVRGRSGLSRVEWLGYLAFRLGRATNPFERMFLANRMFVDVGSDSIPAILASAEREEDPQVRCDALYYLVASEPDRARAALVLGWDWEERSCLSGSIAFLLGTLTPGRSRDPEDNTCRRLLDRLGSRRR